jgi:hypothetical protein
MTTPENTIEAVEEELKSLVQYIERHLHWAKSPDNVELARLNMVTAESLIEAANLVRALCKKLKDG